MDWTSELLRTWLARSVSNVSLIVRAVSISSPVPFEGSGRKINHGNALIAITVSEVDFVISGINRDLSNPSVRGSAVAVHFGFRYTNCANVFAISCKNKHVGIWSTVSTDPNISVWSYINTMIGFWPRIWSSFYRATPCVYEVTLQIEL